MNTSAMEALRERARSGDTRALTALGKRLLLGLGTAAAPQEGYECLTTAAARDDGEATAQLALLAAWGVLRPHSWPDALDLLQRAAELGWAPAQRELQFLGRHERHRLAGIAPPGGHRSLDDTACGAGSRAFAADPRHRGLCDGRRVRLADRTGPPRPETSPDLPQGRRGLRRGGYTDELGSRLYVRQRRPRAQADHRADCPCRRRLVAAVRSGQAAALRARPAIRSRTAISRNPPRRRWHARSSGADSEWRPCWST